MIVELFIADDLGPGHNGIRFRNWGHNEIRFGNISLQAACSDGRHASASTKHVKTKRKKRMLSLAMVVVAILQSLLWQPTPHNKKII